MARAAKRFRFLRFPDISFLFGVLGGIMSELKMDIQAAVGVSRNKMKTTCFDFLRWKIKNEKKQEEASADF